MELTDLNDKELFELTNVNFEAELEKRGYTHGWFKPNDYAGDIYILVNPAFPNLVKIGYANTTEKRMKILNRSSEILDPFHCYATVWWKSLPDKQGDKGNKRKTGNSEQEWRISRRTVF